MTRDGHGERAVSGGGRGRPAANHMTDDGRVRRADEGAALSDARGRRGAAAGGAVVGEGAFMTMHRHKVDTIRLSQVPRGLGASCGRLFVGFEADASCARGSLGANLDVDLRWLRSRVRDLSMRDVHPDFTVISFGSNALARRPEPDRPATQVANVEEAKCACVHELRKI
ncbi:hypothetical protein FJT64_006642 [Amphibalanus amphitrite]|uniref:Uncharacterized protein n=1 Tax=Amphibalanus amphitrite TaxID=1232801 RepID=A0A6A4W293_AMPAM|nr:hypothetical protein FJT64_006642 [Amphibalanus amphitrite]